MIYSYNTAVVVENELQPNLLLLICETRPSSRFSLALFCIAFWHNTIRAIGTPYGIHWQAGSNV